MVGSHVCRRIALVLGVAFGGAVVAPLISVPAHAAEVLRTVDGELLAGDVVELDEAGVLFRREDGAEVRFEWTRVKPISRWELWQSTLAADDVDGRIALGRWALGAELWSKARRTLLQAHGLLPAPAEPAGPTELGPDGAASATTAGETDPQDDRRRTVEALLDRVAETESTAALADIEAALAEGKPEAALTRARKYLRVAPPGEHADSVRARVPDLLVRIEQAREAAKEQKAADAAARKRERMQRWVQGQLKRAAKAKEDAAEEQSEAYAYLAQGNQTRSRRALAAAERGFTDAGKRYVKTARAVGPGDVYEACRREAKDCERRTLDLLKRWARLEVDNKAWKKASAVIDRAMRLDPVDTELLDMRREVDESWIRRRLSGITNASGRESSN